MRELSDLAKRSWDVVVVGGGCTGAGILRDAAMRGLSALLLEQGDLCNGASSRFHGLLHCGGRYAVSDAEAGRECIRENAILKRIGAHCVERTDGLFVMTEEDDPSYEERWVAACAECGIPAEPLTRRQALDMEPALSPRLVAAYRVPDSAVDGFRLVWQNVRSACRYGGAFRTRTVATGVRVEGDRAVGVDVRDARTGETAFVPAAFVVNAAGSWAGEVARRAGLSVGVRPDRGCLVAFNHRFTDHVVNRLHKAGDGDIFVPHGSIVILGTSSSGTDDPADRSVTADEVLRLLDIGRPVFPGIDSYRILRVFAGTRPLYMADDGKGGRGASRNFVVLDHERDGLRGMASICGGKLTTYRLMAERMTDLVCGRLGRKAPCRTAEEALVPEPDADLRRRAVPFFPGQGLDLAVSRLGDAFPSALARMEQAPWKRSLVCECEMVTFGEFEETAADPASLTVGDVRRRTRIGMGTCQGTFCGLRAVGRLTETGSVGGDALALLRDFGEERWHGCRPVLWGKALKEQALSQAVHGATLNLGGDGFEEDGDA